MLLETSKELHLYRYSNGIKLVRPDRATKLKELPYAYDTGHTVANLLNLPFNVYFHDTDSRIQNINEISAKIIGFSSARNAIKKSLETVLSSKCASQIINEDRMVMQNNKAKIIENDMLRNDGIFYQGITVKLPWYNDEDRIVGLFGVTIIFGEHDIANSLEKISQLGLLSASFKTIDNKYNFPITQINDARFTKREIEVINLLIKGRTAKLIAEELQLSKRTVEYYIENIKNKMNVFTKSELIDKIINHNL